MPPDSRAGFLTFTQSGDPSPRYREPSRLDTMPSHPRAFSVRARNHCAKALFFWNMSNRHAN